MYITVIIVYCILFYHAVSLPLYLINVHMLKYALIRPYSVSVRLIDILYYPVAYRSYYSVNSKNCIQFYKYI